MARTSSMDVPIGELGQVPGTASYASWGNLGSPSQQSGRTNNALSPRSQAYMKAGSPGRYGDWVAQGGGGWSGSGGGGAPGGGDTLQQLLSMLFGQQQQQRPDYSQLFMSPGNLESPTTTQIIEQPQMARNQNVFSNKPAYSFGNINPYGGA